MVMLEAKVLWVVDRDFEHEGFSGCGESFVMPLPQQS